MPKTLQHQFLQRMGPRIRILLQILMGLCSRIFLKNKRPEKSLARVQRPHKYFIFGQNRIKWRSRIYRLEQNYRTGTILVDMI